ncbi:hypothetical protein Tco_0513833 [Tanacetum coccineum]
MLTLFLSFCSFSLFAVFVTVVTIGVVLATALILQSDSQRSPESEEVALAVEQSSPPAPKTAKQLTAKRNQERVKSILLLEIPDEYLLKFHNVPDAKSLWAAIKSRFGGIDESKKMQRNVLKH